MTMNYIFVKSMHLSGISCTLDVVLISNTTSKLQHGKEQVSFQGCT